MGTRSLLGYQTRDGKYYTQYMQFDGYPSVKGLEYYETIVTSLQECSAHFIKKNNKPSPAFFKRIKHFLDNYQYNSGHSINNNWTVDDWEDQNVNQEWQYLFDKDGNFHLFQNWSHRYDFTIPWEFTRALITFSKSDLGFFPYERSKLMPFWKSLDRWNGRTDPPMLILVTAESLSFPDQGHIHGWRKCAKLRISNIILSDKEPRKPQTVFTTMFYSNPEKRNKKTYTLIFKSDYITVKNCPEKQLPLLIGQVKRKDAIHLLGQRLGTDTTIKCPECGDYFPPEQLKTWKDTKLCPDCFSLTV